MKVPVNIADIRKNVIPWSLIRRRNSLHSTQHSVLILV